MKVSVRKPATILLAAALATTLGLAGCSSATSASSSAASTSASSASSASTQAATHSVTDGYGHTVEITNDVDSIVVPFPAAAQTVLGLGHIDLLTAGMVLDTDMNKAMFGDKLDNVTYLFARDMNAENLMAASPDFMVYPGNADSVADDIKNTNVPIIGFKGATVDDIKQTTNVIAEAIGDDQSKEKAKAYSDFFDKMESMVSEKTKDLSDSQKPRVYFCTNDDPTVTQGKDTWTSQCTKICGGTYVADDFELTGTNNNMATTAEKIIEADPEIIVCTKVAGYEAFTTDPTYANVSAVKNDKVYLNPLGGSVWFKAHFEAPLELTWLPGIIHPELFSDMDSRAYVNEFYKNQYDYELTDDDYQTILNPTVGSE